MFDMCRSITRSLTGSLSRIALLVICAGATAGIGQAAASKPASMSHTAIARRTFYPEARLRKMHLVRPDLILYPIFYDIYC
jgi:hypothetical protein